MFTARIGLPIFLTKKMGDTPTVKILLLVKTRRCKDMSTGIFKPSVEMRLSLSIMFHRNSILTITNICRNEALDTSVDTYNQGDSTRTFISLKQLNYSDISTTRFELHQILEKRIQIKFSSKSYSSRICSNRTEFFNTCSYLACFCWYSFLHPPDALSCSIIRFRKFAKFAKFDKFGFI
jgi:hypothetical protein